MELKDILAISGKGGLYKYISQARNGIVVESFTDNKRTAVPATAKVSALEDIAVFTDTGEVSLSEVFDKLFKHLEGKEAISHKSSPDELKALLESILPDYDRDRVYVSDMKKLVQWYNQLLSLGLLKPSEPKDEEKAASEGDRDSATEKPGKKTSAKKESQAKPATPKKSGNPKAKKPGSGK